MLDLDHDDQPASPALIVLTKLTAARFNQDWHYHLANAAGRPRCGTSLNLREWHQRQVPDVPTGLCARCARLLGRKPKHTISLRVGDPVDALDADQLALPLG